MMMPRRTAFLAIAAIMVLALFAHADDSKSPPESILKLLSAQGREALLKSNLGTVGKIAFPSANLPTTEKTALGRLLFFDKRLSADRTISCATCHDPAYAWAETDTVSVGIKNQKGKRNAPTVLDSAYYHSFFWDGRAQTLEEQALGPIQNPIEMGHSLEQMVATLSGVAGYKKRFAAAFGDETITAERVAMAIADFERTVVSGPSAFDRFISGDPKALTAAQLRGLDLFLTKGKCVSCHQGPFLTSQQFAATPLLGDEGRYSVTKAEKDKGLLRVPTLRNIALTPPFFHDGSETDLKNAVFFRANGVTKALADSKHQALAVNDQEVKDLTAFLEALSGALPKIQIPIEKEFP